MTNFGLPFPTRTSFLLDSGNTLNLFDFLFHSQADCILLVHELHYCLRILAYAGSNSSRLQMGSDYVQCPGHTKSEHWRTDDIGKIRRPDLDTPIFSGFCSLDF